MAKLSIKPGSTSVILYVKINDLSAADNTGKTGLAYNTSSLTAYYVLPGAAAAAITLATQTVTGAYSSGGFVEVDATNMPGIYRFDIPNACLASGRSCVVTFKGAADMVQTDLEIDLSNQADVTSWSGTAIAGVDTAGYPKVTIKSGTGTGEINLSSGRAAGNVTYWNGTAVPAENTAGYPIVTIKDGTGTGELDTASGKVSIATAGIGSGAFDAGAISAAALSTAAAQEIRDEILASVVETNGSITLKQAIDIILAAVAGVTASGGTVLKDPAGTSTRITATIDGSNNRTAMTLTPSA
jgi:hypothetical protein